MIARLGIYLVSAILAVFFVETFYWVKDRKIAFCELCEFDPVLGWKLVPGGSISKNNLTYTVNSAGFRSAEIDARKKHVLIVGDSVAFGLGVNDNETVSWHLNQLLENQDIQVVNMGVPGYGVDQYYLTLRQRVSGTNPEYVVVVIFTGNDVYDTSRDTLYGYDKPFYVIKDKQLKNLNSYFSKFSCASFFRTSKAVKHLLPESLARDLCSVRKFDNFTAAPILKRLLEAINAETGAYRAKPVFVLSPPLGAASFVKCSSKPDTGDCGNLEADSSHYAYYAYFQAILNEVEYPHVDFLQKILERAQDIKPETLYVNNGKDPNHLSPLGNRLLAETIFESLTSS